MIQTRVMTLLAVAFVIAINLINIKIIIVIIINDNFLIKTYSKILLVDETQVFAAPSWWIMGHNIKTTVTIANSLH